MILVVILVALSLATPTPAARSYLPLILRVQPPPIATPTPVPSYLSCNTIGSAYICAWISDGNPARNNIVTVYGRLLIGDIPQANRQMTATWHYRTTTSTCQNTTDGEGIANCSRNIGAATIGYRVNVDVVVDGYQATTWFIPQ